MKTEQKQFKSEKFKSFLLKKKRTFLTSWKNINKEWLANSNKILHLTEAQIHNHKCQALAAIAKARETYHINPIISSKWLKIYNVSEESVREVLNTLDNSKQILKDKPQRWESYTVRDETKSLYRPRIHQRRDASLGNNKQMFKLREKSRISIWSGYDKESDRSTSQLSIKHHDSINKVFMNRKNLYFNNGISQERDLKDSSIESSNYNLGKRISITSKNTKSRLSKNR